jgi:hypothetical protein
VRRPVALLAALAGVAIGCSDAGGGVTLDPDVIEQAQLDAVRRSLFDALPDDTLFPTLAVLVFPFIDRASHFVGGSSDTTRLVGIELDIDVHDAMGAPLNAQFTVLLGWRGYRPATRTVDSVFFAMGAGRAPVNDGLGASFSPDIAGSGTALILHQAPDSMVTVWRTGAGELVTTASSYSGATTQSGGGLTLTVSRGTLSGHLTVTSAAQVPGGATTVATAKDFPGGTRALKVVIRGTFTPAPIP